MRNFDIPYRTILSVYVFLFDISNKIEILGKLFDITNKKALDKRVLTLAFKKTVKPIFNNKDSLLLYNSKPSWFTGL